MIVNFLIPYLFLALSGPVTVNYHINEESKLFLNGNTNVTGFKCKCNEKFTQSTLIAELNAYSKHIDFQNAKLKIKTTNLDCKNRLLNKDLYTSLKSDHHPYIQVDLLNVIPKKLEKEMVNHKPYDYTAITVITIAGKAVAQILDVTLYKLDHKKIKLKANKNISMQEYNIIPVSPIKMIKIEDVVNINFELIISLN